MKGNEMDRSAVLTRLDGDADLLAELAGLFLESFPEQVKTLEAAVAYRDAVGLLRAAHALKGSVANFVAGEAVAEALKLETMGREGRLDGAEARVRRLKEALERLQPELAETAGRI